MQIAKYLSEHLGNKKKNYAMSFVNNLINKGTIERVETETEL